VLRVAVAPWFPRRRYSILLCYTHSLSSCSYHLLPLAVRMVSIFTCIFLYCWDVRADYEQVTSFTLQGRVEPEWERELCSRPISQVLSREEARVGGGGMHINIKITVGRHLEDRRIRSRV